MDIRNGGPRLLRLIRWTPPKHRHGSVERLESCVISGTELKFPNENVREVRWGNLRKVPERRLDRWNEWIFFLRGGRWAEPVVLYRRSGLDFGKWT